MLNIFSCAYLPFISFGDLCVQIFCLFFDWFVFILSVECPLYILNTSSVPDRWFVNIFS